MAASRCVRSGEGRPLRVHLSFDRLLSVAAVFISNSGDPQHNKIASRQSRRFSVPILPIVTVDHVRRTADNSRFTVVGVCRPFRARGFVKPLPLSRISAASLARRCRDGRQFRRRSSRAFPHRRAVGLNRLAGSAVLRSSLPSIRTRSDCRDRQQTPPPLTWTDRKAELLAALGVDVVLAYPTDEVVATADGLELSSEYYSKAWAGR